MLTTVLSVIQVICCIAIIAVVMLQSGKSAGLSGAISGGAETFMTSGQAKTLDTKLSKATPWLSLVFVVLTLILNLL
ncbi:MAG: preprotein translocase subunit SecG [Oscillospiraceae bacterium]|nr:preprotein translocase subunit SecG [Oscillospiraceae bacterium]